MASFGHSLWRRCGAFEGFEGAKKQFRKRAKRPSGCELGTGRVGCLDAAVFGSVQKDCLAASLLGLRGGRFGAGSDRGLRTKCVQKN